MRSAAMLVCAVLHADGAVLQAPAVGMPTTLLPAQRRVAHPPQCAERDDDAERRLIPRTDDPRLFWLDEWFDTPSERAARDAEKQKNIEKWGAILSQKDTFDDSIVPSKKKKYTFKGAKAAAPTEDKPNGELIVAAGGAVVLLALAVASFAS